MFFTFDGLDGVGKSTQMTLFGQWLTELGHAPIVCRDPGSTELGERLREILLARSGMRIDRRAEMLIYMAARAQLVDEVIRPALAEGRTVVSDRFLLANVVYQAHAGGLDPAQVWGVGHLAVDGVVPDLMFVLDLDPEVAARRIEREPDRMESQGDEFRRKVREGYLIEARRSPDRIMIVDAARDIESIQLDIRHAAQRIIEGARAAEPPGAGASESRARP